MKTLLFVSGKLIIGVWRIWFVEFLDDAIIDFTVGLFVLHLITWMPNIPFDLP